MKINKKPIKYFVASVTYDDPNRYPSGMEIKNIMKNFQSKNVDFQQKTYKSWHVDLIGYTNYIFYIVQFKVDKTYS